MYYRMSTLPLCGVLRWRGDMMIKLDTNSVSLVYPDKSFKDFEAAHNLVVLVADDNDYAAATRRIWELAAVTGMQILLLGLCKDRVEEPGLRRRLVTMASLLQNGKVSVEVKVGFGGNWVETVKQNSDPGDMIVCFAEQRAGLLDRPLSQVFCSNLTNPVYILSRLYPQNPPRSNWHSQIMTWAGSLGILIGAFLLQIRIVSMPADWAQTTLLILSVIGEVWLIGNWNSLFG